MSTRPHQRVCGRSGPGRGRSAGFTMIELLVALVLSMIVLAGVGKVLIDAWSGSGKSLTGATSSGRVLEAMDTLRADLLVIRSTMRTDSRVRELEQLRGSSGGRGLLGDGRVRSLDPVDSGALIDIRDVIVAGGNQLLVRADVRPNGPGIAECVQYTAVTGGGQWGLQRRVWVEPGGGCVPNGGGTPTWLLPRRIASGMPAALFSYGMLCNTAGTGGGCAGMNGCSETTVAPGAGTIAAPRTNWITSVFIALNANSSHGDEDASRTTAPTRVSIRSREESIYRGALGCA